MQAAFRCRSESPSRVSLESASRTWQSGFSLIELMITIAVLAILVALAAPSFTAMINANRITGQSNELVSSLQLARLEAVRRNEAVRVCRTTDGATCSTTVGAWTGWLTVVDRNNEVLRSGTVKAPVRVSGSAAAVRFGGDGLARTVAGGILFAGTITTCIPTTSPAANRRVISVVGGSRVSSDPVNGGGACP